MQKGRQGICNISEEIQEKNRITFLSCLNSLWRRPLPLASSVYCTTEGIANNMRLPAVVGLSETDALSSLQASFRAEQTNDYDPTSPPYYSNPPPDSDPDTINLAFLISLSVTFAIMMIMLILAAAYVTFFSDDEAEYDEEMGYGARVGAGGRSRGLGRLFNKKRSDVLLDSSFVQALDTENDEAFKTLESAELKKMSSFETELYRRAQEYLKMNPPCVTKFNTFVDEHDRSVLKDRGIQSYYFLPSINDNVDEEGRFLPSFLVEDKLDISFTENNKSSSTLLNFPLPFNKKDAVYFEVKVFRHERNSNSIFSVGLTTVPYPYFRIPGMSNFSIAYESTGKLRVNNPFTAPTLLPKLEEGDVVGFGYRYRTGSLFITHNGKKIMDVAQNIRVDLFVSIGAMNASYTRTYTRDGLLEDPDNVSIRDSLSEGEYVELPKKLQRVYDIRREPVDSDPIELNVNLGNIGFVFIEANVKKYSFGSVYGDIGIPPVYTGAGQNNDLLLQKGEDTPPKYPTEAVTDDDDEDHGVIVGASGDLDTYEHNSSAYDQMHNDTPTGRNALIPSGLSVIMEEEVSPSDDETSPLITTEPAVKDKKKKQKNKRKGKKRRGRS
ncbi:Ssh4p KNAG_0A06310 [Huiozyma naganishii CBS 8797]|uniref:B30.2/SPRY domain-containing protein n=1 Tax=Huiozyma naganishii (strain ATCC MYA-139 / BCRC 22969 / CBS 8797 / KCTC 17520 / NBRC 10181 / NCYC 3082 / Yp74L-3) TaxID=1071383 RepID=J7RU12_HUIN7|nr:hypothetical protein KNAG_0A06310 [Kazachstania naganishii CBS 8797]CCK68292.1 hypothetical protein KNAG_0A06310 [Kazachstania naganishii CBS 8797]